MSTVIKVEGLSKAYQLGEFGTGTISRDIERFWARLRGKDDPFLKIGETNDRAIKGESDVVWSLRDVNFEIEQGDTVGIIGRNGAGKSTLLKILSRVTAPTTGSVKIKGRVASLLEVGTGFHPELTGRENIFLNGAILGMRKAEIKRRFDEIVEFAGVERYIDTPVKRYSSGMYVRLAFGVAANLESEILIVDEVLAVGDAEFQKKCLSKMSDVSTGEGRTVLFVSHNMVAINTLCKNGIFLKNGTISIFDEVNVAIKHYLQVNKKLNNYYTPSDKGVIPGVFQFHRISLNKLENDHSGTETIGLDDAVVIKFDFELLTNDYSLSIGIELFNIAEINVFKLSSLSYSEAGRYTATCIVPPNFLNDDVYTIDVYLFQNRSIILMKLKNALQFEVKELNRDDEWYAKWIGVTRPNIPIDIEKL